MKINFRCRASGSPNWLRRFSADRSGNVAILFAACAVVLMIAIGAAVDIGRWLQARDQTIAAMDAAVLAGGRALQTDSTDTAGAVAAAQKFYQENVTSRLPVTGDTVHFSVVDNGQAITASGKAYLKTAFLKLALVDKLPLVDITEARAERKIGKKEIAVMLDVTGSMQGQKLKDLKDAAQDLVKIVLPEGQSPDLVKVALVPFSEDIRLPTTSAMNAARGTNLSDCKELKNGNASSCSSGGGGGGGWGGWGGGGWGGGGGGSSGTDYYLSSCVVERSGNQKYTDAAPSSGNYVMAHYTEDTTGSGSNKKGKCTIPDGSEVMPLTSNKTSLLSKINSLSASGGTAGHLGTAWTWYTLSPSWASLWSASSQPQSYDTPDLQKVAILMTDGEYNTEYDKNGVRVGSADAGSAVNGNSETQAAALCTAMKQKGISVYTIGFDLSGPYSTSYQTLKQCASDPDKFYTAITGEQLKQAFRDIGLKLSKLHLSK